MKGVGNIQNYSISFFLYAKKLSCQHSFKVTAETPQEALAKLLEEWPDAILPFSIDLDTGQGLGHKLMRNANEQEA